MHAHCTRKHTYHLSPYLVFRIRIPQMIDNALFFVTLQLYKATGTPTTSGHPLGDHDDHARICSYTPSSHPGPFMPPSDY